MLMQRIERCRRLKALRSEFSGTMCSCQCLSRRIVTVAVAFFCSRLKFAGRKVQRITPEGSSITSASHLKGSAIGQLRIFSIFRISVIALKNTAGTSPIHCASFDLLTTEAKSTEIITHSKLETKINFTVGIEHTIQYSSEDITSVIAQRPEVAMGLNLYTHVRSASFYSSK
jgi:hypothetical protein